MGMGDLKKKMPAHFLPHRKVCQAFSVRDREISAQDSCPEGARAFRRKGSIIVSLVATG